MEQSSPQALAHSDFLENAIIFKEKYELANFILVGDERYSKRKLKGYSSRACRFCRRSYPDVPFSNYSHLLPQLIGNSNMYSDFECDECNAFFSGLENDLAAFLGISRSIVGLQEEKKAPSFVARGVRAKSRSFIGENILILAPEDIKSKGNTATISYTKNPYTPSNVYKALLKSALSLLDDLIIKEKYQNASNYLMGKIDLNKGAVIRGYRLSFSSNIPLHVFCFRKKFKEDNIPEHVICFNFRDHIIALPLLSDAWKDWNIIIPPPYFLNEAIMHSAMPVPYFRDLSSTTQVLDEEETFTIQLDTNVSENTWCYDPLTDKHEQKPHNLDDLQYMVIARNGVTIDPKELSAFIDKQMNGGG